MKLWEIGNVGEQLLLETVDRETGEISDEGMAALQQWEVDFKEKALAVAKFIAGQRLEARAIMDKAEELKLRASKLQNHADGLQNYLSIEMFEAGVWIEKPEKGGKETLLQDAEIQVIAKKSFACEEVDKEATTEEYRREIPPVPASWAPDKKKILADLKQKVEVPGWELEKRTKLEIV